MTGPNRQQQTAEVQTRVMKGAREAIAAGYAVGAVIDALRAAADELEGK